MVALQMPASVKEITSQLYDAETRPGLVAKGLSKISLIEKYLDTKAVEYVASLSTIDGILECKRTATDLAAPYIAKACDKDGRKELFIEASELATEKIYEPTKQYAAPYVAQSTEYLDTKVLQPIDSRVIQPTKEFAAPYIAMVSSKKQEMMTNKKFERAVEAVQYAREHPTDVATDLKMKAIDLLKYDDLASYRDYVMSEEFAADTLRLIKVELPTIAADASSRGMTTLRVSAANLAVEIDSKREKLVESLLEGAKMTVELAKAVDVEGLKARTKALLVELKLEITSGVAAVQADGFSREEAIARIQKIYLMLEAAFSPMPASAEEAANVDDNNTEEPTEECAKADGEAEVTSVEMSITRESSVFGDDYADAEESIEGIPPAEKAQDGEEAEAVFELEEESMEAEEQAETDPAPAPPSKTEEVPKEVVDEVAEAN